MKYLIVIGALVLLPLAPVRAQEAGAVVISEVGWAGSSLSTADEFVELANLTDEAIDLSGYRLAGGGDVVLPAGSAIPARGAYLVANFAPEDPRSALARTPDLVSTAVALSNSALSLVLEAPDGAVVDRAGDGGAPLAGRTSSSGSGARSMARILPVADGTLASSWLAAETADGIDEGLPDLGTPGTHGLAETVAETPETEPEPAPEAAVETAEPSPEATTPVTDEAVEAPETAVEPAVETLPEEPVMAEPVAAAAPPGIVFPPHTLLINEVYPVPGSGEEEFAEILNPFNNVIPLKGWALRDASGAKTSLPDQMLGLGQAVVLRNPKGRLNNDGDALELLAPDGSVNDAVAYGKDGQRAGRAFVRVEDHLEITAHPTPGEENLIEAPPAEAKAATRPAPPAAAKPISQTEYVRPADEDVPSDRETGPRPTLAAVTKSPAARPLPPPVVPKPAAKPAAKRVAAKAAARPAAGPARVSVSGIRELAANKRVSFAATVTAAPGAIGKQLMAVQDESGGITVYRSDGKFPALSVGDRVRIAGVTSSSQGMARVRLDAKSSVTVLGKGDGPPPRQVERVSEQDAGSLIRIAGMLVKDAIETEAGTVALRLPSDATAKPGARVQATGILLSANGTPKLVPRSADDLLVLSPPPEPVAAPVTKNDGRSRSGIALTALTLCAVAAFALRPRVQSLINRYAKRPALAVPAQAAD